MKSHRNWPMARVILRVSAAAVVAALALAAMVCKRTAPPPAPPTPEVVVTEVIQRDVPLYSEWVGTTEGFVNAEIYPKISGYLIKQNYKDGDRVRAGQLLFQIDDREYKAALDQALGNLARMEAQLKQNQQDLARYTALFKAAVIPKQQFDTQTQTTRATAAQVQSAQAAVEAAKLNLDWTRVISPIEGIAGIAKTQVGDLVSPTTLLTTVSQLDPIKVTFPISEREYLHFADRIREHQEKGAAKDDPTLEMVLADGSTYKYPGHFYALNRQVNVQTGTIQTQGVFPNPDNILRPGLYAKVRVAADVLHNALLIPQAAVLSTQGQNQVAVVGPDNRVSLRTVTIGKQSGNFRIIAQGLNPGERVITEGLQKVTDGMEVKPRFVPAEPARATPPVSADQAVFPAAAATSAP
jgi:membrane fusion protein (multidrug efflux system)